MGFITIFIGSFLGTALALALSRRFTSTEKPQILETNLTKHIYVEKENKKSVYRDKEIEKEEAGVSL